MEGGSLELLWVEIRLFHGIVREKVQQSQIRVPILVISDEVRGFSSPLGAGVEFLHI